MLQVAAIVLAFTVLTAVMVVGLIRVQMRPVDAGVAIGLATGAIAGSATGDAMVRVDVMNGNRVPFDGRVSVHADAGAWTAAVHAESDATATIRLSIRAGCGERITVAVEGPDAPDEPLNVTVDCSGVAGG